MTDKHPCESCSMPIETGRYCPYCVDASGELQPFDERFERMLAFQARRTPDKTRAELVLKQAIGERPSERRGRC